MRERDLVLYFHATPFGDNWFSMHVFTSKLGSLAAKPRAHWYSTVRPTKNEEFRRKIRPLVICGIGRLQTEKQRFDISAFTLNASMSNKTK